METDPVAYNHVFSLAFSVVSRNQGEDVTAEELRAGIDRRMREIMQSKHAWEDEIVEACGVPYDTFEYHQGESYTLEIPEFKPGSSGEMAETSVLDRLDTIDLGELPNDDIFEIAYALIDEYKSLRDEVAQMKAQAIQPEDPKAVHATLRHDLRHRAFADGDQEGPGEIESGLNQGRDKPNAGPGPA